jgi:hypothetical protein
MREVDLKLLWARSGNRCSWCRTALTLETRSDGKLLLGEQAHIVSRSPEGPRGVSPLTIEDRDRYHNLILLCPTHHELVDKAPDEYPVEVLHKLKSDHELWVEQTLAQDSRSSRIADAQQVAYAHLVDSAVRCCGLEDWFIWTSYVVGVDMMWPLARAEGVQEFRQIMLGAVLPGVYPEIERALQTLAFTLHRAKQTFGKHAELDGDILRGVKFYRFHKYPESDEMLRKWEEWQDECERWVFLAAKSANWLADAVRLHLNPHFFLVEGKFLIQRGPVSDLSWETLLFEFTEAERAVLPKGWEQLTVRTGDKPVGAKPD